MAESQESQDFKELDVVKKHVESWKDFGDSDVKAERLSGLTNEIWKITANNKDVDPQAVVYRKFGDGGSLIDRDRENYIIKGLAKAQLSADVYGGTNDYRVEKFHESRTIESSVLKEKPVRRRLARLLAELHQVQFEKLDHYPVSLRILEEDEFLNDFHEKANRDVYTEEEQKMLEEIKTWTSKEEIDFLKSIAPKKESSVVFSHNDLHAGNILQLVEDDSFVMIDFEYSHYNYRGFDIANFFNESVFEYDKPDPPHFATDESSFPDDEELIDFCKYYLFFCKYKRGEYDLKAILEHRAYRDEFLKEKGEIENFNEAVKDLIREVKVCQLYSHYFWGLWAVGKSHQTEKEFDYMRFAYTRYELYHKLKEDFLKKGLKKTKTPIDKKLEQLIPSS